MANNLYDTGGTPGREVIRETVIVFPVCKVCGRQTRTVPCEWCDQDPGEHARRPPVRVIDVTTKRLK